MNEFEARKILSESQVEIAPDDHRTAVEIVQDPRLGLGGLAAASQLEFVGLVDTGTYTAEDANREGIVVEPHAFGQRVYRPASNSL